ncbi:response regulator [Halorubrum vacuolatum]|uniref:Response regulator receiver domain-containing protein n=1 Tax=Halorubrum vacuolatum TaxID=63740 RepID=A0A238VJU8_HALVU|nr:response regulator [Halorubrum vacuolatum]SNR34645.1 Response regulator receiver domain-containing protein [Halorubrum vacuolatum]
MTDDRTGRENIDNRADREATNGPSAGKGIEDVDLLLVEDNHDDARFVERLVHERQSLRRTDGGTPMIEVRSIDHVDRLADAIGRVRSKQPPDVVLLDLMLPDSRGLTTVERMLDGAPTIPIVVLTGQDEPVVGIEAVRRGAQDYLNKDDITGEGVLRALRNAMERSRTRRELADRNHRLDLLHRIVRRDIRNELSVVIGLGDGLRESVPPAEVDAVETLLEAAERAAELTDTAADVIDVISTDEVGSVRDLHAALDAAIDRVHAETAVRVVVDPTDTDVDEPITVRASPMLESAFVQLLSDAVDRVDRPDPRVDTTIEVTETSASVAFTGDIDGRFGTHHDSATEPMAGRSTTAGDGPSDRDPPRSAMRVGSYLAATLFESFDGDIHVEREGDGPRITVTLPRAPCRTAGRSEE